MFFLRPGYLMLAVPALVLLSVLHMLKLRRQRVVIPSLLLWNSLTRDEAANTPLQRLRRNPLFVVQCLLIVAVVSALAKPAYRTTTPSSGTVFLIIDTGLTMQTVDGGGTRIQKAAAAAARLLERLHPSNVELISAGRRAGIVTPLMRDRDRIVSACNALRCDDCSPDIQGAVNLATNLAVGARQDAPIIELITDGCWVKRFPRALSAATKSHIPLHIVNVGSVGAGGLVITGCSYAYLPDGRNLQVLTSVHNSGTQPVSAVESVRLDGNLIDARSVKLSANHDSTAVYQLPAVTSRHRLLISLDPAGPLPAASQARLILGPPSAFRVLLVGTGTKFLKRALLSDPAVRLWIARQYPGALASSKYDVVVFCNQSPANLPHGNYLFVHCLSNRSPVRGGKLVATAGVNIWHNHHPVLKYVSADGIPFANAIVGRPVNTAQSLAETSQGSLIVAKIGLLHRQLFCGFYPGNGSFVMSISFPILISNAIRWLTQESIDGAPTEYHAGTLVTIPGTPADEDMTITYPNGHVEHLKSVSAAPTVRCDKSGYYVASAHGYHWSWVVNPESAGLRSLGAGATAKFDNAPSRVVPTRSKLVYRNLWRSAVVVVLVLLCAEWWVYHRRPL